ncbi:hypothetical protein N0V85_003640 [Neurospora sp. IMI 360204]|nr:hypothetical protein N0V85_003640 [Neurospora sp. IMI 360204]
METPYHQPVPFLPLVTHFDLQPSHLRFFLTKTFTYIGLATQADAANILAYLFNLSDTKTSQSRLSAHNSPASGHKAAITKVTSSTEIAKKKLKHILSSRALEIIKRTMILEAQKVKEAQEGSPEATNYLIYVCPWRWHLYAVYFIVFLESGDLPVVTGCSKVKDMEVRSRRMFYGYWALYTFMLLALVGGGGEQLISRVHFWCMERMKAPRERLW